MRNLVFVTNTVLLAALVGAVEMSNPASSLSGLELANVTGGDCFGADQDYSQCSTSQNHCTGTFYYDYSGLPETVLGSAFSLTGTGPVPKEEFDCVIVWEHPESFCDGEPVDWIDDYVTRTVFLNFPC